MTDEAPAGPASATVHAVARNTAILFAAQLATWCLAAAVVLVVPRVLGPVAIGHLAIAASLWAVAGVAAGLGTSMLMTLEAAKDHASAGQLVGPILRARLAAIVIASIIVVLFTIVSGYPSAVVRLAVVFVAGAVLSTSAEVADSALVGLERIGSVARADVVAKLLYTALVLIAALTTRDVVIVAVAAISLPGFRLWFLFRSLLATSAVRWRTSWSEAIAIAKRASPYLLAGLAIVAYQQVDLITMSFLVDDDRIGWYGAADGVFTTLLFAPSIMMRSLMPTLTREHARDRDAASTLVGTAFDTLVVVAVVVGLTTVLCSWSAIDLLFGGEFSGAGGVLAVLGVVLLFTFFSILFGAAAYATGRQRVWNGLVIIAMVATIPLDLAFVPWAENRYGNGAIGGAMSYVVTESAMVVVGVAVIAPRLLTRTRLSRVVRCLVAGGVELAVVWPLRHEFVAVPGVVGVIVYAVMVFLLRIPSADDRRVLARARTRLTRAND